MGALGNVLAFLSMYALPLLHPQIALDLSHLATFIVSIYSGPVWGLITGALVALAPFYRFGVAGWFGPLVGLLIIPGKAITGLFSGIFARRLRPFPSVTLGFVPETIFIYAYFKLIVPLFIPTLKPFLSDAFIAAVLAKAWVEIVIMGFLMEIIKKRRIMESVFAG
jgi:hypothetical protein